MKLSKGDRYLTIALFGGQVKLSAFKNKEKTGNQPDYRGDGIAIWINEKKDQPTTTEDKL